MSASRLSRVLTGGAVLALLALFAILLLPVYVRNYRFERALKELAAESDATRAPDEFLRVRVVDRAARLGLPIRPEQVKLERKAERVGIDVRYVVPIDLPLYSVDLHFHPAAKP